MFLLTSNLMTIAKGYGLMVTFAPALPGPVGTDTSGVAGSLDRRHDDDTEWHGGGGNSADGVPESALVMGY